jgi:hypothetical protein
MYQTIGKCQFHDAFKSLGRDNQFSYEGLDALYDYLEQYEEDTGEKIELDVIALCCEYSEYDNLEQFRNDYDSKDEDGQYQYNDIEDIRAETEVIEIPGSEKFIILQF